MAPYEQMGTAGVYSNGNDNSDHDYKGSTVESSGKYIRLGFVRKVYGILSFQLTITVAISCFFMFFTPATTWIVKNSWMMWVSICVSLVVLFVLFFKRNSHPLNMILLSIWTVGESLMIGLITAFYSCAPVITNGIFERCDGSVEGRLAVAQALGITMLIFIVLTIFTVQSKIDFSFLGMGLSVALMILIFWGILIAIFGRGFSMYYLYALAGSIIFSLYIVYDTYLLFRRLSPDEYILAAINLYLDVINLFVLILALLGGGRRN